MSSNGAICPESLVHFVDVFKLLSIPDNWSSWTLWFEALFIWTVVHTISWMKSNWLHQLSYMPLLVWWWWRVPLVSKQCETVTQHAGSVKVDLQPMEIYRTHSKLIIKYIYIVTGMTTSSCQISTTIGYDSHTSIWL